MGLHYVFNCMNVIYLALVLSKHKEVERGCPPVLTGSFSISSFHGLLEHRKQIINLLSLNKFKSILIKKTRRQQTLFILPLILLFPWPGYGSAPR